MEENRWSKMDKGTWKIHVLQCEDCKYKNNNPMVCDKFPDRKPREILKRLEPCPKYEKQ